MSTRELNVIEGKILKLNHVLARRINPQEMMEFQKIVQMFEAYTKAEKLTLYGPMVVHNVTEIKDGIPMQLIELMGQLREVPKTVQAPYTFTEQIRIENCLYLRFCGPADKISVAYQKLSVYSYENDLIMKGDVYTVHIDNKDNIMTADIFAEAA